MSRILLCLALAIGISACSGPRSVDRAGKTDFALSERAVADLLQFHEVRGRWPHSSREMDAYVQTRYKFVDPMQTRWEQWAFEAHDEALVIWPAEARHRRMRDAIAIEADNGTIRLVPVPESWQSRGGR